MITVRATTTFFTLREHPVILGSAMPYNKQIRTTQLRRETIFKGQMFIVDQILDLPKPEDLELTLKDVFEEIEVRIK